MEQRLSLVTLGVADLERSRRGYSGYFADPDGHLWEVAWNPFWTFAVDGGIRISP